MRPDSLLTPFLLASIAHLVSSFHTTSSSTHHRRNYSKETPSRKGHSKSGNFPQGGGVATFEWDESTLRDCDAVAICLGTRSEGVGPPMWLRKIHPVPSKQFKSWMNYEILENKNETDHGPSPCPNEAIAAIEATRRWASDFVRPLHLCPWAGSSLDTPGAIRYWVLLVDSNDTSSSDDMQSGTIRDGVDFIVRAAGRQLEHITTDTRLLDDIQNKAKSIDSSAAIAFVILVPWNSKESPPNPRFSLSSELSNFDSFHERFLDLEDRLLDECDAHWDREDQSPPLPDGCRITIAAFHPLWKFGNSDGTNDPSIDYEKMTPYPTISMVLSSSIDALLDSTDEDSAQRSSSVTERIAEANERTLCSMGVVRLKEMFESNVVCPQIREQSDD